MAQFSYEQYAAKQQATRNTHANGDGQRAEVHFMGEFLRNDGDVAVVRFPYTSMSDVKFETIHNMPLNGRPFGVSVRCADSDCPLCAQGIPTKIRFFCKATVYVVDEATGTVKPMNAVWDRPSAFADIDIKNLIQEYGDLTQHLFKIKRNGSGTATRYTISIVMNSTVYNPHVYRPNFEELESFDAKTIVSKSIQQYNEALNPSAKTTATNTASQHASAQPVMQPVQEQVSQYQAQSGVAYNPYNTQAFAAPQQPTYQPQPVMNTAVEQNVQSYAEAAPANTNVAPQAAERKQVRYQF